MTQHEELGALGTGYGVAFVVGGGVAGAVYGGKVWTVLGVAAAGGVSELIYGLYLGRGINAVTDGCLGMLRGGMLALVPITLYLKVREG